jgi:hypothetical protein
MTASEYTKPTLTAHGSVASLTLSTPGSDVNMMMVMMVMMQPMGMVMGM